jgi:flap endonuclease-1
MIVDAEKLLDAMGVPSIHAPSEGEAQVTHMVKNGDLWACASQDWDSLLFGAERLIRNLSITGKRKLPRKQDYIFINPEMIYLKEVLKELDISQEQLIILAMLVGTDYCPGIMGYGPKKSYSLVKEAKTIDNVLAKVKWDFNVPAEKILEWFKHPKVTDSYSLQWKPIDHEKVLKHMVDEHEFSQERIQNQLDSLQQSQHKKGQTGLGKFF